MKRADRSNANGDNQAHYGINSDIRRSGIDLCRAFPHRPTSHAVTRTAALLAIAAVALSTLGGHLALAQNPRFNPPEIKSDGSKKLRGVIELTSGEYKIPGIALKKSLRQFRGRGLPPISDISPGPTLRARLGDMVEISFLNKVDDTMFPYTPVTAAGDSSLDCDETKNESGGSVYPKYPNGTQDTYPNCFHGSSTANIHFHGTHTSPDGLGDNVLVQVLPQTNQLQDWPKIFNNEVFKPGTIPEKLKWSDMPREYRETQLKLIKKYDEDHGLTGKKSLLEADERMIDAGLWPQYLMGAFPNFFRIPDFDYPGKPYKMGQAPGTHWYHAHKHGSTSLHIQNGLAGAFIIESSRDGGYDHVIRNFYKWGNSYGDHEKIFVFQQFDPIQNLERSQEGRLANLPIGRRVFVNGQLTPTIVMKPGEVQLWRFINATEGNNAGKLTSDLFTTKDFTFKQTAMDGVQFSQQNYKNQPFLEGKGPAGKVPGGLALAAGNRADVLVKAPENVGRYEFKSGAATLFYVQVEGGRPDPPIPADNFPTFPTDTEWAKMPEFLNDLPRPGLNEPTNQNSPVRFQWEPGRVNAGTGNGPRNPPHFMINDKQFDDHQIDQCMPLDGLEDWVLENWTSTPHPFHIHINPFQVIRIDTPTAREQYTQYRPQSDFVWQDVITIPAAVISPNDKGQITNVTPGKVTIRHKFVDFTGTYVLHCHILAHEDRGMMQLVRVVPADRFPGNCQVNIPAHH
jgi:FtsP/CotA-like multicopper oxidase with cupredoxin domain